MTVDYKTFVDQTGQGLESPPTQSSQNIRIDPPHPRDRRIFGDGLPLYQYLDLMLGELGDTRICYTDKLIAEYRKDRFQQALHESHRLLAKHSKRIYDSVYHALAFAVAMEFDGFFGRSQEHAGQKRFVSGLDMMREKIKKWITIHKDAVSQYTKEKKDYPLAKIKKPVEIYTLILDDLKPKFAKEGFGWGFDHPAIPNTETTAEWEHGRVKQGLLPRWELFPVYSAKMGAEMLNIQEAARQEQAAEEQQQEAVQVPERSHGGLVITDATPYVGNCPILLAICKKIGEGRFAMWFGQNTTCEIENGTAIFTVRNIFAVNSMRRHCSEEIKSVLAEHGVTSEPQFRVQPPVMSREEEVKQAMESARQINADEPPPKKNTNRSMSVKQFGKLVNR
jgi:hypothetical protein